jgi:hypothetical protein
LADAYRSMQVAGDPRTVRARIEELAKRTAADEIMVTTNVYDHAERLRSYERLAEVFEVASPTSRPPRRPSSTTNVPTKKRILTHIPSQRNHPHPGGQPPAGSVFLVTMGVPDTVALWSAALRRPPSRAAGRWR